MFKTAATQRFRWVGAVSVLLTCLAPFACSKDEDGLIPPPCMGSACGKACSATPECGPGLYCDAAMCKQDCLPGSMTCGAGKACSAEGRCVSTGGGVAGSPGGIITTPNGGSSGGGSQPDACAAVSVEFDSETPNVLLLVDQSGSMTDDLSDDLPRWTALRTALLEPMTGLVPRLQAQVNFGLTLYTGPDARGLVFPSQPAVEGCPYLTTIPIAPNNQAAIEAAYLPVVMPEGSVGQTPTGESLQAAAASLMTLDQTQFPGRRVIVLATDGEPDSCDDIDDDNGMARQRVVNAATAAFEQGISVFVISVGNDVGEEHLREVANVGQGFEAGDPTDRYYRALDAAQLEQAFADIVNGVRECVFNLEGEVTGDASGGTVTVDGMPVTYNDENGWRLNGPSEVEILGTTCETIKTGDRHAIDISFPCETVVVVPR